MNELRWILLGIGLVLLVLIYLFSRRASSEDDSSTTRYEPALTADGDEPAAAHSRPNKADLPTVSMDAYADDDSDAAEVLRPSGSGRFDPIPSSDSAPGKASTAPDPKELDKTLPFGTGSLPEPRRAKEPARPAPSASTTQRIDPEPAQESTSTPIVPEKVIALHLVPGSGQLFDGIAFIGAIQAEGLKFGRFDIFHRFADPDEANDATPSQFSLANMIKPGTFSLRDLDQQQFKGASMFLVLPGPEDAVAAFADMVATGRRLAATLDGQLLDAQGTALSRQSASHLREDIINYQHGLSAAPAE